VIGNAAVRCAHRRLIDRHFAARIKPREESALRAHLPDCDPCRERYERHMLYAQLVPGRPRMAERLAVGLGIDLARNPQRVPNLPRWATAAKPPSPYASAAPASEHPPSRRSWVLVAATAAACVALLVNSRMGRAPQSEFGVRGPASNAPGPTLEIYRVTEDGSTKASEGWMSARGELAFAYRNPTGFARLMVFGADDRGDIYWFHPAWTEATQDPVAVAVVAGEGPFELPEAIHHDVRGSRLRIVALFTNAAVSVRAVEEALRSAQPDPAGSVRVEMSLEVRP
jgi:hypothetical protein